MPVFIGAGAERSRVQSSPPQQRRSTPSVPNQARDADRDTFAPQSRTTAAAPPPGAAGATPSPPTPPAAPAAISEETAAQYLAALVRRLQNLKIETLVAHSIAAERLRLAGGHRHHQHEHYREDTLGHHLSSVHELRGGSPSATTRRHRWHGQVAQR